MAFLLSILGIIIALYGVVRLYYGEFLCGVILLIVAAIVGPGGYSIFQR